MLFIIISWLSVPFLRLFTIQFGNLYILIPVERRDVQTLHKILSEIIQLQCYVKRYFRQLYIQVN